MTSIFLDSFSGAAAELPKAQRTSEDVLRVLAVHPRVSTWDMCEKPWLRARIRDLKDAGRITEVDEPYPWHRFAVNPPTEGAPK